MNATMTEELIKALSRPFAGEAVRQKRGQGNRMMDYVSHGMVTKRLNDVYPGWHAEMVEKWIVGDGDKLHCLGGVMRMTIGGVTREEAGGPTRQGTLADDLKNTYSDCLKRCAMRFGVALDMWESAEENDEDADDYAGSQAPYQKDGGGFAPFTPNRPAQPAQQARSNGSAPTRPPQPPTPQRPPQTRPQPLNAAPVGSPYDDAEYERLSRQVRTNDDALSPNEYNRYHELDRLRKEQFQAAKNAPQQATAVVAGPNPHPEGSVEYVLHEARAKAAGGMGWQQVWAYLSEYQQALGADWGAVVKEWRAIKASIAG